MKKDQVGIINLEATGIMLITLYMLTQSLYVSIFNSVAIQIIILSGILYILLIGRLGRKSGFVIKKIDVFFILAIIGALGSLHNNTLTIGRTAGPVIFSLGILISLLIRSDIDNYDRSISTIKWAGVFYALSVMFSYFNPRLYQHVFLSILRPNIAHRITLEMQKGFHSGFTGQVAYTAGYIVNAMGIICCCWIINDKSKSIKEISLFIIMFLGLLFTQKRAHLLLFFISWFFVYVQYSRFTYEKVKKIFKVSLLSLLTISLFAATIARTNLGQILFGRLIETFYVYFSGGDITSRRIFLYKHAWDIFLQNPIWGIGWGNFSKTVVGNITVHTEMQVHNIYLQLLCETGIIGFILILSPFFATYFYTIKTTRMVSLNRKHFTYKWISVVLYSLYVQTFFLLYGLVGNPLYDYSFLMMYFLGCGLIYSFWKSYKKYND